MVLAAIEQITTRRKGAQMEPMVETGRGSTGNIIAAIASFFLPGLGQLAQGRILAALFFFVLGSVLWIVFMGWLVHIWATIDAAMFSGG